MTGAIRRQEYPNRCGPVVRGFRITIVSLLLLLNVSAAALGGPGEVAVAAEAVTYSQVSAGYSHTCGLKTDGNIVCWGSNNVGQTTVPAGSYSQVSAGDGHTCGLKTDGGIVCWGFNNFGQATAPAGAYSQVSAGVLHSCGLRTDGSIVCWGQNNLGQTTVPAGSYSQVSGAYYYTCGLKTDGNIVCWGSNTDGQANVPAGSYSQVSTGARHTCGLKTDGSIVCWGNNSFGQTTVPPGSYGQVSVGGYHTCGVRTDGATICWGPNPFGQTTVPAGSFSRVSAGNFHTCGLKVDGSIICWGDNRDGQSSVPDSTPPGITPTVTGTLGNNGWHTSDVDVNWNVTDSESGITASTGCGATTISTDTTGTAITCTATSAGGTSSASVTIKRDATAPTLAPSVSPETVFVDDEATVSPNATDATSGVASQDCDPVDTSSVGEVSVTCTATDHAGNTSTTLVTVTVGAIVPPSTIVVNDNDSGPGSLRQVIADVPAGATITFDDNIGRSIVLTSGQITLTKDVTIQGLGASFFSVRRLDDAPLFRIFQVNSGVTATISDMIIRGGRTNVEGGGILNQGTLTLDDTFFEFNAAGYEGGGVFNGGTLTVSDSTFANNTAEYHGGGLYNSGTLAVTTSAFANNSASRGGGISNFGGTATVTNSTVSNNSSGFGGGVYNYGTLSMAYSTISGNWGPYGSGGMRVDSSNATTLRGVILAGNAGNCYGESIVDAGYNLADDASCGQPASAGPLLSSAGLADNGGVTPTILPDASGPALNAIPAAECVDPQGASVDVDQRGVARPQGRGCDIGAVELERVAQTISFDELTGRAYGDAPFTVSATATSGLPVTFAADGPCSVDGASVTISGVGDCTITASQAGDATWDSADNVARTFAIGKGSQTIAFGPLDGEVYIYGDDAFPVSATASSGLSVSFAAEGDCTVAGSIVTLTGAGGCTVTASQAGDATYLPADSVARTFSIVQGFQRIDFAALVARTFGEAPFPVSATASSGLPVSFEAEGECTVTDGVVALTGAGKCVITASQPGNDDYRPAPSVARAFAIGKATQTIAFEPLPSRTFGDTAFELNASTTSGLTVAFAASGACIVSGALVTITGAGVCEVVASQPGDDDYLAAEDVRQSFTIDKAAQSIAFAPFTNATYGDGNVVITASASSGLPVAFEASGACVVVDGMVAITGAGSCSVTASQAGNEHYLAAEPVERTFAVARADQTIVFDELASKTWGDASFQVNASTSSGLPVSFTASGQCSASGATISLTGAGECTVVASQSGDTNYNPAADVSRTFAIAQAEQAIDFGELPGRAFGDTPFDVSATASSGLPVSFAATGTCTINGVTVTLTGVGECAITATQVGDADYRAAPEVVRSFHVADTTAPAIVPQVSGIIGNDGWYTGDVTVSWTVVDAESAVTTDDGCAVVQIIADTDALTLTCTATSEGGATSASVTIKRDATAPVLAPTVSPNPVYLNGSAAATPNASDALSGLAGATCGNVDARSVGTKLVTCSAVDAAGNTATATVSYQVHYVIIPFVSPVDWGIVNKAKAGQTVPLWFWVLDANGKPVKTITSVTVTATSLACGAGTTADLPSESSPGKSGLKHHGLGIYQFRWKTPASYAGSCKTVTLTVGDGGSLSTLFRFK